MKVVKASSRPTKQAPAEYFTGTVYMDEVLVGTEPSRMRATSVSFTARRPHRLAHPIRSGRRSTCCMAPAGCRRRARRRSC